MLGFTIARRYFFSRKSPQAINILSWISMLAILISTAAMVILLSVQNGMEELLQHLYKVFSPELRITPAEGKFFVLSTEQQQRIKQITGIASLSFSIEDMVMLEANEDQRFGMVKGVDETWMHLSGINSFIAEGRSINLQMTGSPTPAIAGVNIAALLGINVQNPFSELNIYYPNPHASAQISTDPASAFNEILVKPEATFKIQAELDEKYILLPLAAAQELFSAEGKVSSVDVFLKKGSPETRVKKALQTALGDDYKIETRDEQNHTLWMIMQSEKMAIFVILTFVLILCSFNLIGALSMVVIDKKRDISILKSMGATQPQIRHIFLNQGLLLTLSGAFSGIVIGILVVLGQQTFKWIGFGDGFIVDAYPVALRLSDIFLTLMITLVIGLIAAWRPSGKAATQSIAMREE